MKESFILYTSQKEMIDKLSNEQAGILVKAIYEYSVTGVLPNMPSPLDIAIIPIKQSLDRNNIKYENVCERNRENGKLGRKT